MKTVIYSKGQIVLPAKFREADNIQPGQQFNITRIHRGEYRLVRCNPLPNEGLIEWLLACPVKGYFVPIKSESTDSL